MFNLFMIRFAGFLWLFFLLASVDVGAQITPSRPGGGVEDWQSRQNAEIERRQRLLRRMENRSRREPNSKIKFKKVKITDEVIKKLIVDPADYAKYESFLKLPGTGIFKLVPTAKCPEILNRKESKDCVERQLSIGSFANAYSFHERQHTVYLTADISIDKNRLLANRSDFQTIVVDLGETDFENVTLESEGLPFLRDFQPKTQIDEAREQSRMFSGGVSHGKYKYSKVVDLTLGRTYGVRTIAFEGIRTLPVKKTTDLIVILKLIRLEEDGSATFVWKELSRQKAPKLIYRQ